MALSGRPIAHDVILRSNATDPDLTYVGDGLQAVPGTSMSKERIPDRRTTGIVRSVMEGGGAFSVADRYALSSARASFQMRVNSSPAGIARAIAADCPAHTCIRCTSPAAAPASFIAAVRPRCTG